MISPTRLQYQLCGIACTVILFVLRLFHAIPSTVWRMSYALASVQISHCRPNLSANLRPFAEAEAKLNSNMNCGIWKRSTDVHAHNTAMNYGHERAGTNIAAVGTRLTGQEPGLLPNFLCPSYSRETVTANVDGVTVTAKLDGAAGNNPFPILLCIPYLMPSTDIAYAATRCAMRCPVLT
eukprot:187658-Rhodomonas_salina.1